MEPGAAATLVVSQDVDLAVPVDAHQAVKERLEQIVGLVPSTDEPSVWVPRADRADLIELNFLGLDPAIVDPIEVAPVRWTPLHLGESICRDDTEVRTHLSSAAASSSWSAPDARPRAWPRSSSRVRPPS